MTPRQYAEYQRQADVIEQHAKHNHMNNEYIIISKTAIQKRIEELEEEYKSESAHQFNTYVGKLMKEIMIEIMILKQILSQSTPLIPEIESAYYNGGNMREKEEFDFYISNLKLDI